MDEHRQDLPVKGRGAVSNPTGRFERHTRHAVYDGWDLTGAEPPHTRTVVAEDRSRSVLARNNSPDISFDRSINPYRGCEHGCIYCFARPTHAWLGLSPGMDFETRIFAKSDAPALLEKELRRPGYRVRPVMLGPNTDAYQPIERERRITRGVLKVLAAFRHPVVIVTKSEMVTRDLDILGPMARDRLAAVGVSITTLDPGLARRMEPRAAAPHRRIETLRKLAVAGIPTAVLVAPIIPALTDTESERILEAAAGAGASSASYVMLRLPHELKDLFTEWLHSHVPDRAERVLNRLRDCRDGQLYVSEFGNRMRGTGPYADLIAHRFSLACRRLGLEETRAHHFQFDETKFYPPDSHRQLSLF